MYEVSSYLYCILFVKPSSCSRIDESPAPPVLSLSATKSIPFPSQSALSPEFSVPSFTTTEHSELPVPSFPTSECSKFSVPSFSTPERTKLPFSSLSTPNHPQLTFSSQSDASMKPESSFNLQSLFEIITIEVHFSLHALFL